MSTSASGSGAVWAVRLHPLHDLWTMLRAPFAPRLFASQRHVAHYAHGVRECRIWAVDVISVPGNAVFFDLSARHRAASSVG